MFLNANISSFAAMNGAIQSINAARGLNDAAGTMASTLNRFLSSAPDVTDTDGRTFIEGYSGAGFFSIRGNFIGSSNGASGVITQIQLGELTLDGNISFRGTQNDINASGVIRHLGFSSEDGLSSFGQFDFDMYLTAEGNLETFPTAYPVSRIAWTSNQGISPGDGVEVSLAGSLHYNEVTNSLSGTIRAATFIVTPDFGPKAVLSFTGLNHNVSSLIAANGHIRPAEFILPRLLNGNDTIFTQSANDSIGGYGGNDIINTRGGNDLLIGGAGNDKLYGGLGNDNLNGGAGVDTMYGEAGNDVFYVDNVNDVVIEGVGGGTDMLRTVFSTDLRTKYLNVENLALLGNTAVSAIGNSANNVIHGNALNNIINGLSGTDAMFGYAGNDIFYVDNSGDVVVEGAGAGIDTVNSTASFTLGANIENLVLLGAGNIDGTGNTLRNRITGNAGNNLIDGGLGNDVLTGALGNDNFVFSTALDAATNVDVINGFVSGSDTITLDSSIFTTLAVGPLAADVFGNYSLPEVGDEVLVNFLTGDLYYDADGLGGSDPILFARLNGAPAIDFTDVLVSA